MDEPDAARQKWYNVQKKHIHANVGLGSGPPVKLPKFTNKKVLGDNSMMSYSKSKLDRSEDIEKEFSTLISARSTSIDQNKVLKKQQDRSFEQCYSSGLYDIKPFLTRTNRSLQKFKLFKEMQEADESSTFSSIANGLTYDGKRLSNQDAYGLSAI